MASKLQVGDITIDSYVYPSSGSGFIGYHTGTGSIRLGTTGDNLIIHQTTGLATFSNGINLGNQNLEYYGEGTWTPVIEGGTSAGTYTSVYASATYTRVGRVVTVNFVLDWNSHTGTGALSITGLPFTCLSNTGNIGTFQCNQLLAWTDGSVPAMYATGTTITYRCTDEDGGAFNTMQIAATGSYLRGTLTYFT